jgi:hypothetical protein
MTSNFADILNTKVDTIEKPKPLPVGSYVGLITKVETGESAKQKTPLISVKINLSEALGDVDLDLLEKSGGFGKNGKEISSDYYLTEKALFRIKELAENHLGLDTKGMTLGEVIQALPNNRVGVEIAHRSGEGDAIYMDVKRTFLPE